MAEQREKIISAPLGLVTEISVASSHSELPGHLYLYLEWRPCTLGELEVQIHLTILSEQHEPKNQALLLTPDNVAILKDLLSHV